MSVDFTLASKTRNDVFKDQVSINDSTAYNIDCTAWQDDNEAITGSTWVVKKGGCSVENVALSNGVISAQITSPQAGTSLISIALQTASGLGKVIWLEVGVKDMRVYQNDYNLNGN